MGANPIRGSLHKALKSKLNISQSEKMKGEIEKDVDDIIKKVWVSENKKQKKGKKKLKIFIVISLVIYVGLFYYNYYSNYIDEQKIIEIKNIAERNQKEIEEIPVNISFEEIIQNYESFYNIEYSLAGYLNRRLESRGAGGIYIEYIEDDFGNEINLINLKKNQLALFPKDNSSMDLFNVTGIFKRKYKDIEIDVLTIEKID